MPFLDVTATVHLEDDVYVAQAREVDIASHGQTQEEALAMLQEALELHFSEPYAAELPTLYQLKVPVAVT